MWTTERSLKSRKAIFEEFKAKFVKEQVKMEAQLWYD
jgi:hypothetical protein